VVLFHGGGNFGDLWRDSANFRNRAVKQIKDNDLIFLPQSLNYTKPTLVKSDNTTFQLNNRTLFMFRDYPSLNYSLQHFTNKPAMYVPDMAFILGPQTPVARPIVDIILLLRLDQETTVKLDQRKTALNTLAESGVSFEVWDFPVLGFPLKLEKDNKTVVYNYTKVYPKQLNTLSHNSRHSFLGHRTQMANNLFSRGRLIITNRLHATIFTTLMGKPVIYLDNTYKKIANVRGALAKEFSECTDQNLRARHAVTLSQAVELALQILSGSVKI
jgi:exopolysaccharide biosynthesis predicted pyruvyltransferase EpsI